MSKVPLCICVLNKACVECLPLIPSCLVFNQQGKTFLVSDHCLQHAFSLHHNLCSSLLLTYQGLFGYFTFITKDLPSSHRMELGTHYTVTPTGVSELKRMQSKYSAHIVFCFKFISTDNWAGILKVLLFFALIVNGFHCFFSSITVLLHPVSLLFSFHFTWFVHITTWCPLMDITTSNPHSQFNELIYIWLIVLIKSYLHPGVTYVNYCTRAKLSQRLYVTDTCLLKPSKPKRTDINPSWRAKKLKVKYAYMCNLTSQAQHASPIWESTQKTLSPKSKARLHRYVLILTVSPVCLCFSAFQSFLPFYFHRKHTFSITHFHKNAYSIPRCYLFMTLLCFKSFFLWQICQRLLFCIYKYIYAFLYN